LNWAPPACIWALADDDEEERAVDGGVIIVDWQRKLSVGSLGFLLNGIMILIMLLIIKREA
jgi:hypothetical protein